MPEDIDILPEHVGFLEEAPKVKSWTRLALTILVIWWVVLSGYLVFTNHLNITNSAFMSAFLAAILGAKIWSRKMEK